MKDFLGVGLLFTGYVGTALLVAFLGSMSLERALMFVVLFAVSQVRWFNRDESPVPSATTPKQSFMSRIRGE